MNDTFSLLQKYTGISKYSKSEVITPQWVVSDMVDLLPQEVFNPDATFFDPAVKSSRFLIEIYNRLMASPLLAHIPEPDRHKHILENQLYGFATSPTAAIVTRKALYNSPLIAGNIVYTERYLTLMANKTTDFRKLIEKEFGEGMKFDVVIGNPPYQDAGGRASIYPKFVDLSLDVSSIVCMITRDNWLNGKAFKGMRDKLSKNGAVSHIVHYPKLREVFKEADVPVAYFIWHNGGKSSTHYTCIKDSKIVVQQELSTLGCLLYKSDLGKSILEKIPDRGVWSKQFNTRSYPFMDQRKRERMYSKESYDSDHTVGVKVNNGNPIFVNREYFPNNSDVEKYKVMCGVIINEAFIDAPGNVLTNIVALGRNTVASETWSLIATFESEQETLNCKKYITSKFVRFIANQSVNGRSNVTDNTFECVPLQDFTSNSDIDWSQSVSDIDKQLYEKYGLKQEEMDYIESTIKPME